MRSHWISLAALIVVMALTPRTAVSDVLYQTGFEPPKFVAGLLHGQDSWSAFDGISVDAATVSTDLPRSGAQSLRIDAARLDLFPGFGSIRVGFYVQNVSFDPLASGVRFVELSADFNVSGRPDACVPGVALGDPGSCAIGIGLDDAGFSPIAVMGVNIGGGRVYAKNSEFDTVSAPYTFGEWAHLTTLYDFQDRSVHAFVDGVLMGKIPFSAGVGNNVVLIDMGLGVAHPDPVPGLIVHLDNVSVATVPGSSAMVMLSAGILGLFGFARWQRKRRGYERGVVMCGRRTPAWPAVDRDRSGAGSLVVPGMGARERGV